MFFCVLVRFRAHVAGSLGSEVDDVVKGYGGGDSSVGAPDGGGAAGKG
jgi:hypothetical protein